MMCKELQHITTIMVLGRVITCMKSCVNIWRSRQKGLGQCPCQLVIPSGVRPVTRLVALTEAMPTVHVAWNAAPMPQTTNTRRRLPDTWTHKGRHVHITQHI